jgi:hypothetical protein
MNVAAAIVMIEGGGWACMTCSAVAVAIEPLTVIRHSNSLVKA